MQICAVFGIAFFTVSLLLSFLWSIGSLLRHIGVTYFNILGQLFLLGFPVLCIWLEWMIFDSHPQAWGIALFPIIMNLFFLFLQYFFIVGSMILGKRHIYRIGHGFLIKKYTFDEIKKCSGNYSSGLVIGKISRRKATTFTVRVVFTDGTEGEFDTNHRSSPKARYFLDTIKVYQKNKPV